MSAKVHMVETQLVLPTTTEVIQVGQYEGVSDEDRITLSRLIRLASQDAAVHPEPQEADFEQATPHAIEHGLYIPYSDPRYHSAEQLVRLGVDTMGTQTPQHRGVVFPSSEFYVVARNARDLARHTEAKTRNANKNNPDRDEVRQKVGRSVGHTLSGKIESIVGLSSHIKEEVKVMRSLYRDLRSPWQAHYKVKNLEKKRVFADERIHETAEVSTINLNLGSSAVKGLHGAIKKNLYGENRTHAQTAHSWHSYITLVGRYMGARVHKLDLSKAMCKEEFARYQHFLEPEVQAA
jgi:hypothetical protein